MTARETCGIEFARERPRISAAVWFFCRRICPALRVIGTTWIAVIGGGQRGFVWCDLVKTVSHRHMPACALRLGLRMVLRFCSGCGLSVNREHGLRFHDGCRDDPGLVLTADGQPITTISGASAPACSPAQRRDGLTRMWRARRCAGEGEDVSVGGRPTMFRLDAGLRVCLHRDGLP